MLSHKVTGENDMNRMRTKSRITRLLAVLLTAAMILAIAVPVSAKKVKKHKLTLKVGDTGKLSVRIGRKKIKKVRWTSSDSTVVRISKKNGKLRALKPGKAVITGKYKKGRYKVTITVKGKTREKTTEKTTEKTEEKTAEEAKEKSAGQAENPPAGQAENPSAGQAENPSAGQADHPSAGQTEDQTAGQENES